MPGSNRDDFASAFRLAIYIATAFAALVVIWQISGHYTERRQHTDYRANQYAESANRRIASACSGVDQSALIECVTKEVKASREDERTEYDLKAQQDSADAAFWMAIVSFFSLAATVVALWFVKGTLDATRDAVRDTGEATEAMREANDIARYAQRPWVTVEIRVLEIENTEHDIAATYEITFENVGQTAARNFHQVSRVFFLGGLSPRDRLLKWRESRDIPLGASDRVILPGETYAARDSFRISDVDWATVDDRESFTRFFLIGGGYYSGDDTTNDKFRTIRSFIFFPVSERTQASGVIWKDLQGVFNETQIESQVGPHPETI